MKRLELENLSLQQQPRKRERRGSVVTIAAAAVAASVSALEDGGGGGAGTAIFPSSSFSEHETAAHLVRRQQAAQLLCDPECPTCNFRSELFSLSASSSSIPPHEKFVKEFEEQQNKPAASTAGSKRRTNAEIAILEQYFGSSPLVSSLRPSRRRKLYEFMHEKTFAKDEEIMSQGRLSAHVMVLVEGQASTTVEGGGGAKEPIFIWAISALVHPFQWQERPIKAETNCRCLLLCAETFRAVSRFLEENDSKMISSQLKLLSELEAADEDILRQASDAMVTHVMAPSTAVESGYFYIVLEGCLVSTSQDSTIGAGHSLDLTRVTTASSSHSTSATTPNSFFFAGEKGAETVRLSMETVNRILVENNASSSDDDDEEGNDNN